MKFSTRIGHFIHVCMSYIKQNLERKLASKIIFPGKMLTTSTASQHTATIAHPLKADIIQI